MINNNNLYKSENKIPTKSDLEAMIGASIFLIFISTTKTNNPTITRIIAVVGVIAIAILSIAKVTRKQLSPAEVCKYFGILGIIGSVTMAGMFSVAIATSYQSIINIFLIFLIAQVVVIALIEFKHSKKLEYKKIQKNIVTTSMFVPFAVLGSRLAKYLDSSDMKIVVLLLMFLLWVAYISFHLWFIKYRKMSK